MNQEKHVPLGGGGWGAEEEEEEAEEKERERERERGAGGMGQRIPRPARPGVWCAELPWAGKQPDPRCAFQEPFERLEHRLVH